MREPRGGLGDVLSHHLLAPRNKALLPGWFVTAKRCDGDGRFQTIAREAASRRAGTSHRPPRGFGSLFFCLSAVTIQLKHMIKKSAAQLQKIKIGQVDYNLS